MDFRTTVVLGGRTATGLQVPDEIVARLGGGKRPPVVVTVERHTYRTTVAPMGGAFWIPLAAEHREAAGVEAEQEVAVSIALDSAPREVAVPRVAAGREEDPLIPQGAAATAGASSRAKKGTSSASARSRCGGES